MNDNIRRTAEDAERHPRRPQHLLLQGAGALGWGLFFSISPVLEILVLLALLWIPLLVSFEIRRAKQHGFFPGALIRLALVALVVIAAHLAPLKYEDSRTIGPLSGTQLTLSALAAQSSGTVVITAHPREVGETPLQLPSTTPTLRQLIREVEAKTPLRYTVGYCGNAWTLLWGGAPIFARLN